MGYCLGHAFLIERDSSLRIGNRRTRIQDMEARQVQIVDKASRTDSRSARAERNLNAAFAGQMD